MKLKSVQIREFQSIRDSNPFEVSDVTCLVGKNEAGKTALLKALYRLNPIVPSEGTFDVTEDYPRAEVEDYRQQIDSEARQPATVVRAVYSLDEEDLEEVVETFGPDAVVDSTLTLSKGYAGSRAFELKVNEDAARKYLLGSAKLPPDAIAVLSKCSSVEEAANSLVELEQTEEAQRLSEILSGVHKRGFSGYIFNSFLKLREPKYLYFDEYYQMKGQENIETLQQRKTDGTLLPSDHPMLGLIELARLDFPALLGSQRTQELVSKLEAAGNHLTRNALKYWSQNRHLQITFDVRPGRPGDPAGLTSGTNIWARVYDTRHLVTTSLGTRSRGFVWFFSFLAWYSQVKKKNEPLILLLDEPGLSLHAKAQGDLLRYFEEEVKGVHQLIYTTHSPFMVDPHHFERVQIVQDRGIDSQNPLPPEQEGTKVLADVLDATGDSLFPLQGALGYEIYQTLFVGPNSLIVEGASDLLYLQTLSSILEAKGRTGLNDKWTITPVGGSDKVPTFVALVGAQKGLKVVTLIDIQKKDKQSIEDLYKRKLLKKSYVLTFADFTGSNEADIEDMFESDFYLRLVNDEYGSALSSPVSTADLNNNIPRMIVRLETYFSANSMKNGVKYNHFRPARYFSEHISDLTPHVAQATLDRFEEMFKKLNKLL